eukprot:9321933-Alexandrium_andersonii.AAC.1
MSASLVGSEMCIRDSIARSVAARLRRWWCGLRVRDRSVGFGRARGGRCLAGRQVGGGENRADEGRGVAPTVFMDAAVWE